jgi:GvpD gas vesicle protein
MSAILRLPSEIVEFSLRDPPRSLLVRGTPGSGKTTLALTLLSLFRGKRIYLTSRVSRAELAVDYPWLQEATSGSIEILETFTPTGGSPSDGSATPTLRAIPAVGAPGTEDAPLPLPPVIADAFGRIHEGQPCMVVIDSWDALVERYLDPRRGHRSGDVERGELERALADLGRGRVHLVLIVERSEPTQLDYLVDGVVGSEVATTDGRTERWIRLLKMRGVRIEHPSYPFSLEGARFLCIDPMPTDFEVRLRVPQSEPDPRPGWIWPGSTDFAAHFGRLPLGRISLIETDDLVPIESVRLLYGPALSQVAVKGGRTLHILPPSVAPEEIVADYEALLPRERLAVLVRIASMTPPQERGPLAGLLREMIVPGPQPETERLESRMPEASGFLNEVGAGNPPNLGVVWLSGLHPASGSVRSYSPETFPALVHQTVATGRNHLILVGSSSDRLMAGLREMAAIRIEMRSKSGRVFVYGQAPLTPPLLLTRSEVEVPYRLVRVV